LFGASDVEVSERHRDRTEVGRIEWIFSNFAGYGI